MQKEFRNYEVVEVIAKNTKEIEQEMPYLKPGHRIGIPFETQEDEKGEFFEFLRDDEIVRVYLKPVGDDTDAKQTKLF